MDICQASNKTIQRI
uniref:Uncharacterized protein n=1 Tax=Rhizophora mucronata TaxID=61149 RepID=A0A2P2PP15_RHIMU